MSSFDFDVGIIGGGPAVSERTTLVELLRWRAALHADQKAYTFLSKGEEELSLTYAELDRQARAIGAMLQRRDATGERVLLLYPAGLEYIAAFFGCLYAGALAVPAYPPHSNRSLGRIESIIADAQATFVLTTSQIISQITRGKEQAPSIHVPGLQWITTDKESSEKDETLWQMPKLTGSTIAFLQYTSGSTATPKGVMVSHSNLLSNLKMIHSTTAHPAGIPIVSWLPIFHDMGLIAHVLQALHIGSPCILLPPAVFVQSPFRWLEAISLHQAYCSGAPNFAYDLCVAKITPEQRETLDLSSWKVAFCGAEPVRSQTLTRFAEYFAPCGFRVEALKPVYGLAEATVFVTGHPSGRPPLAHRLKKEALEQHQVLLCEETTGEEANEKSIAVCTSCGKSELDGRVIIVDPETGVLSPVGKVGEIWITGSHVARGYWNRKVETETTFHASLKDTGEGPFLRTGDLGFLLNGDLFVTGRLKDIIIIQGRNHYPQDLEQTAQRCHAAVRPECGAAFSVSIEGEERVVLVQEIQREVRQAEEQDQICRAIRRAIAEENDLALYGLVLIRYGSLPKTSSGKIQRSACRSRFLEGSLNVVFQWVRKAEALHDAMCNGTSFLQTLQEAPEEEYLTILTSYMQAQIARMRCAPVQSSETEQPLLSLGFDSLLAIELKNRIERDLQIRLPILSLLQGPSLTQLVELVLPLASAVAAEPSILPSLPQAGGGGARGKAPALRGGNPEATLWIDSGSLSFASMTPPRRDEASPSSPSSALGDRLGEVGEVRLLSHNQRVFWFLSLLAPESSVHHLFYAARVRSRLSRAALQRALRRLSERYPILTATYTLQNGEPVQRMQPNQSLPLDEVDATSTSLEELSHLLTLESNQPIDLTKGPVLRLKLYRCADDDAVLGFFAHHIVTDLWALKLLVEELARLYAVETNNVTSLPEQSNAGQTGWQHSGFQHTDYVRWQQSMLGSKAGERHWQYWQKLLAGDLPVLNLPLDRPRPSVRTYKGAAQRFSLDSELVERLRQTARREQVTLFTLMLTAYQVLLYRYTQQDDILVGTLALGRTSPELEHVIGSLANLVIVHARFGPKLPFRFLLQQTKRAVLEALEHQDFPFPLLVERLQLHHHPNYSPLYQTLFLWDHLPARTRDGWAGALFSEPFAYGEQGAPTDLLLTIFEREDQLTVEWRYSLDVFDAGTISRLAEHFLTVLDALTDNWEQWGQVRPLQGFPLLSESERHTLLLEWNATKTGQDVRDLCVHQLFELQVEQTPDALAISQGDGLQMSYHELNAQANHLAHCLLAEGVGPEHLVGIYMERSTSMLICILAIFKVGGAYLPLDPSYPEQRLHSLLQESQIHVLLSQTSLGMRLDQVSLTVLMVESLRQALAFDNREARPSRNHTDNLAYVIYTSGSTGKPKGVMVTQRGMVNHLLAKVETLRLGSTERIAQTASACFDISVWQFLAALLVGGQVCLVPDEIAHDPELLFSSVREQDMTVLELIPSLLQAGLDHLMEQDTNGSAMLSLHWMLVTGEACHMRLVDLWKQCYPQIPFVNAYGPTECSDDVTHAVLTPPPASDRGLPDGSKRGGYSNASIGRPIANTQIYILDQQMQPLPIGVVGEIYVGGRGVGRGYLYDPVRTALAFVPNPFLGSRQAQQIGACRGERLYRTGDRGRYRADGAIEYLGRTDQQVKIRGFRVELGEIEATLMRHPVIREAVVVLQEETEVRKYLVAYVVPQFGASSASAPELQEATVQEYLQERLPDYMVPSRVVFLERLPKTSNGKVERSALPVSSINAHHKPAFVAPRTPVEQTLADIWQQVLGIQTSVGIHENFFALGGDSILIIQVIVRTRLAGWRLTPKQFFQHQTIADLSSVAEALEQAQDQGKVLGATPTPDCYPVGLDGVEETYPLTPLQQGLLFHTLAAPQSVAYRQQVVCRMIGEVSMGAFERAWQQVIKEHAILRTAFVWQEVRKPLQVVFRQVKLPTHVLDWRGREPLQQETDLETFLHEERAIGFDLGQAPLMRLTLIRLQEKRTQMIWTYHHILLDGWSLSLLLQEVFACYEATIQGKSVVYEERRLYRDYIRWIAEQESEKVETYWRKHLSGITAPTPLGVDRDGGVRTEVSSSEDPSGWVYAEEMLQVDAVTTARWREYARDQHVTLHILVQAAWALVLSRYSGQTDVVFGTVVAGRSPEMVGVERMIGLFINTLPVRVQVKDREEVGPWLRRLQEQWVEQQSYEYSSLVQVQRWSEMPHEHLVGLTSSHNLLFESLLVFENYPMHALITRQESGLAVEAIELREQTNYPLTIIVVPGAEMRLRVSYDRQRFEQATAERLLGHLKNCLEQLVADQPKQLARISLLTHADREQLLVQWNETKTNMTPNLCVHQLFERQVKQTPDSVALIFEDELLTYQGLNAQANRLAHRLRGCKVGPDILVGVCIEPSLELVVAQLAVLKAGGAYVPLDPSSPASRLKFMLADAHITVVVTELSHHATISQHKEGTTIFCLDQSASLLAMQSVENPCVPVFNEHLAYVIYTSGSTGEPKGVLIPHANVLRLFAMTQAWFDFQTEDVWTLFHSSAFDFSVWEIWGALLHGGSLAVVPYWVSRSPDQFAHLLRRQQVTILNQTPSAFRLLMEEEQTHQAMQGLALRLIIFGGEALNVEILQPWMSRHGKEPAQLINMYGITETTVHVTSRPLSRADVTAERGNVIGRAIPDLQLYVLDKRLQLVPIGVPGELYVGGMGLARGYLRRPELTAERFLPHPWSQEPGARLYRTGDLVRYRSDGDLEYLGRTDHQVKIRGFRVELGEIEATLTRHSAIREAVVLSREDIGGEKRLVPVAAQLVAYVVGEGSQVLSVSELRNYLQEKLPDYMVPAFFVSMSALPLSTNGKVDRKALPPPNWERSEEDEAFLAPCTVTEKMLATIWEEVLHTKEVGVRDNFFERGGDSILCLQVVARARQKGLPLTIKQIFQYPTIEQLAANVGMGPRVSQPVHKAPQGLVEGTLPLTPIQRWFFELDLANPHHWNQALFVETKERMKGSILQEVVGSWLVQHDALRLRFTSSGNGWQQSYSGCEDSTSFFLVDLQQLPQDEQERVTTKLTGQTQASLDLVVGPLARVVLFERGKERTQGLLMVIHHLVVDGVSWRILLEDLQMAYQQRLLRQAIQLPAKTSSFKEWAEHLQHYACGESLSDAMRQEHAYWLTRNVAPVQPLPRDFPEALQINLIITQKLKSPRSSGPKVGRSLTKRGEK